METLDDPEKIQNALTYILKSQDFSLEDFIDGIRKLKTKDAEQKAKDIFGRTLANSQFESLVTVLKAQASLQRLRQGTPAWNDFMARGLEVLKKVETSKDVVNSLTNLQTEFKTGLNPTLVDPL